MPRKQPTEEKVPPQEVCPVPSGSVVRVEEHLTRLAALGIRPLGL